jgi:uncharacterized protein YbjT (DUF2867 family)
MNILVTGGTGTVGSAVVRELVARKADVHVLTRDPRRAGQLPSGAHAVVGDILEPATVRTAFTGRDAVFLLNPVSATESHEGLMGVNGVRHARVKRLVYMSVQGVDTAAYLPHFGSKAGIEAAIRTTDTSWTILRPNSFYQNDHWLKVPLIEHGVYPQPLGSVGLSRVDVGDIARAAAIALTADGHGGRTYVLAGPDVWTGAATAAAWSEALGRAVVYGGDDLEAWEERQRAFLPAWMAYDFARMFEYFQMHGLIASPEDVATATRLLGRPPRSFVDFARETAGQWKGVA